ncbi:MAG: metallophosphatase family protein [Firmicutes bacterium]|nr:metallophosphatase family protein [Bacillota bacterium]
MRVLILSDVHANPAALEAVLTAEPRMDRVLFLGDAVDYGPEPRRCVELLAGLDPVRVRGNHDHAVAFGVDTTCSEAFRPVSQATRDFSIAALDPEARAWLGRPPLECALTVGGQSFLLVHASPLDPLYEYADPVRNPAAWEAAVRAVLGRSPVPDVVLLGHTHRPYIRQVGRVTVANPGSVGQPRDGDPRAAYAVWEDGRLELRRVPYDVDRTVRALEATGLDAAITTTLAGILRRGGPPPHPAGGGPPGHSTTTRSGPCREVSFRSR